MTELELDLARKYGASLYLVYRSFVLKGSMTPKLVQSETGLSVFTIFKTLRTMKELNILTHEYRKEYRLNHYDTWKIQ